MSDSENVSTERTSALDALDEEDSAILDEAITEVEDGVTAGVPYVTGRAHVRVMMAVDATSPTGAVEEFKRVMLEEGLNSLAYMVTDEITKENWFVVEGRVLTPEELSDATGD